MNLLVAGKHLSGCGYKDLLAGWRYSRLYFNMSEKNCYRDIVLPHIGQNLERLFIQPELVPAA
jgi:hypothetical protein